MKKCPCPSHYFLHHDSFLRIYIFLLSLSGFALLAHHEAGRILTAVHENDWLGVNWPLTACLAQIAIGCLLVARKLRRRKWLIVLLSSLLTFWLLYLVLTFYSILRIGGIAVPR